MFQHHRFTRTVGLLLLVIAMLLLMLWGLIVKIQNAHSSKMLHISRQIEAIGGTDPPQPHEIHSVFSAHLRDCGGTTRPSHTTRMRNNVWHLDSTDNGDIMVFSAFYDDRECFYGKIYIRLLVVTSVKSKDNLFCQIWYGNYTDPLISKATSEDTGRGLNYKNSHYQERLYSCEVPKIPNMYPTFVSLSNKKCKQSQMYVPVVIPVKKQIHEIGICVVVAYGELERKPLVEWVELNKILGVGEINVYDSRVGAKSRQVFEYYASSGVLKVHKAAPSIDDWCKWCQKLTAIASLNDCMYRNMYRYRHLAVIDFDEYIIPTKKQNIIDMLETVRGTWVSEPAGYMFRNAYFFLDIEPKYKVPSHLVTSRFVTRQEASESGYSPKSIINPRKCMVMQNHYCMKRTPDVSVNYALYVKPKFALSHHYKRCHFKKGECLKMMKHTLLDESARRYTSQLNSTVFRVLNELKIEL